LWLGHGYPPSDAALVQGYAIPPQAGGNFMIAEIGLKLSNRINNFILVKKDDELHRNVAFQVQVPDIILQQ
jgi:hypothetical protein